ncbi:MAG: dienelactone hydrolase family protein [Candidatus Hydrogenedentes bacterium]|nr:dienelactone hydrolase family protein [Candidatus Hydrogenedentota bacterium]
MGCLKKGLLITAACGLLLLCIAGIAKWRWDARFYDGYDPGQPLNAEVRGEEERPGYRRVDVVFDGLPGQRVPTLIAFPPNGEGPFPCAIFLHGIGQKKEFLDDIAAPFVRAGFVLVCSDQYTRGERRIKGEGQLDELLALRRRAALNVIETRRLVDYLLTRPDVDPGRIYLVGASFGAITGSTAAAFEPRIRAAVLTYGGGNLRVLLDSEQAEQELGRWHGLVRELGAFILAPADPVRHVAGIAPRPVLFQNGRHDSVVPAASGQALFDAAREPKEMVWYESDHVGLDREHVFRVLDDAIQWLISVDK